jgi:tetratricopeptide (TPR) repeat protein
MYHPRRTVVSPAWTLHFIVCFACCTLPAFAAPGTDAYLAGLDALEQGNWADAAEHLTAALKAEPENPDYFTARGVAYALGELPEDAQKELDRANRLRPNHTPTKLWLATVIAMQGDFSAAAEIYPYATRDPYESAVRRMSHEYGDVAFRQTLGDELAVQQARPKQAQARQSFVGLARQFVERAKPAGAAVSTALGQRGIQRAGAGDHLQAYRDLTHARKANPNDLDVLYHHAAAKLAIGSPEGARADLTALLLAQPDHPDALLRRAEAHADLGDAANARLDLDLARGNNLKIDPALKKRIDTLSVEQAEFPPPQNKAALLDAFRQSLNKGPTSTENLIAGATTLVRAVNADRIRSDERYQNEVNALRAAANRPGAKADDFAALGQYLYTQAFVILGEAVEPQAQSIPYRPQTDADQDRELAEAEAAVDKALAKNPKHARALAFKGACRLKRAKDWKEAEGFLKRAIEADDRDPIILDLFAQVMDYAAFVQAADAADLRSTESWSDAYYIYYRYPSEAERRAAAELDALARRMWEMARKALEAAADAQPGKATAYYYRAVIAERDKDFATSAEHLRKAVQIDPNYFEAWQRLSTTTGRLGNVDEAYRAQSKAVNLVHTSAGPLLKLAWIHLTRTAFQSASKAIDEAAALDPADSRVAAYRAAILREQGDLSEAGAWFIIAGFIEQVRLADLGLSPQIAEQANLDYTADQIARLLAINNAAADITIRRNKTGMTYDLTNINFNVYQRVPQAQKYEKSPNGLLPEVPDDPTRLPEAPTVEALVCWTAVHSARANANDGQFDRAQQQFDFAANFEQRKPPTMDQGMIVRIPGLWAKLGLVDLELQRKNPRAASQRMQMVGHPSIATADMKKEIDRLRTAVETTGNPAGGQTYRDLLDRQRRAQQRGDR